MSKYPYHRKIKNFLIHPAQLKIIGLFSITLLAIVLFFEILTLYRMSRITQVMTNFYNLSPETRDILLGLRKEFMQEQMLQCLVFILCVTGVLIILTHRTYGPLVAVKRFVRKLIDGDYANELHLRKKDDIGELAGLLNELAHKLKSQSKK